MKNVTWRDYKTNEEVLTAEGKQRCVVEALLKRRKNSTGHVMRVNSLLKPVTVGRMVGKKPKGRPRMGMIDDLKGGSYT
jgi:hypothetical protein